MEQLTDREEAHWGRAGLRGKKGKESREEKRVKLLWWMREVEGRLGEGGEVDGAMV